MVFGQGRGLRRTVDRRAGRRTSGPNRATIVHRLFELDDECKIINHIATLTEHQVVADRQMNGWTNTRPQHIPY